MKYLILAMAIVFTACNGGTNNKNKNEPFTAERKTVSPLAVKEYTEDVNDKLNPDWKFKVALFEQKESLKYEVRFQYKEVTGEKIFTFPNMGFMPKPELRKGPEKLSCIIGFYDADSTFMELRMIKVENENLVYKHLKEYKVEEVKK